MVRAHLTNEGAVLDFEVKCDIASEDHIKKILDSLDNPDDPTFKRTDEYEDTESSLSLNDDTSDENYISMLAES